MNYLYLSRKLLIYLSEFETIKAQKNVAPAVLDTPRGLAHELLGRSRGQ